MYEAELAQVFAFMANGNTDAAARLLALLNAELDALEEQLEPEIQVHAVSH